jgi:transcriptional regulator with XRE-family HTH domain
MNRLKLLRAKSDITLRELSKYVNIRNATLNLIENNKQPMREIHVLKLTNFFDVTSDYLLGYSNNGIGIYFEDDDDHTYISESELIKLSERYNVKEILITHSPDNFVLKTQSIEFQDYRGTYSLFRSINVSKKDVDISDTIKEKLYLELNKLGTRDLEKILKFINEYIK